MFMVNFKN